MVTSNGPVRLGSSRRASRPTLRLVGPRVVRSMEDREPALLAEGEAAQYDRLPSETRRRDWLAGRLAAKVALRDVMRGRGSDPALHTIVIGNDERGAPVFVIDGRSDRELGLVLSVAHAGGTGVAAVADAAQCGPVGVDVEPDRPLSRERLRAVVSLGEWRVLDAADRVHMPSPLGLWMLKEAVFKAERGVTFASPLQVELHWRAERVSVRSSADPGVPFRYRLSWRSHQGIVIACAVRVPVEPT